jgi:hypothetical protein
LYRSRRDLTFVLDGGPGEHVLPAGTTLAPIPASALTWSEAIELDRIVRLEAKRSPDVRFAAVRWEGRMRILGIGDAIEPLPTGGRRRIVAVDGT